MTIQITAQNLQDRALISDVVISYACAVDQRDWTILRSIFTDRVFLDFRSFDPTLYREVPAEEALRIGLIGHVVPDGTALEKALEIANVIGQNGPLAVEAIKRSVRETEGMSEVDGLARELEIGWPVFASNDATEGQKAFAEKRPPQFTRT